MPLPGRSLAGSCRLGFLLLCLSSSGCQNFADTYAGGAAYRVPPGTVLTLNTPLQVAPHAARVSIQEGKAGRIDRFYPYCRFELAAVSRAEHTIMPGDYTIVDSGVGRGFHARNGDELMYTAAPFRRGGNQPSHVTFTTFFYFDRESPSELYRLSCARLGDWYESAYVTVKDAQATLGPVATFQLPIDALQLEPK